MKNKRFRVWTSQYSIDIDAKKLEFVSVNDRPIKIRFLNEDDYLVAEFYCDRLDGWAEMTCLVNYAE